MTGFTGKPARVLLGTPFSSDHCSTDFTMAFATLCAYEGMRHVIGHACSSSPSKGRNILVEMARKAECTHLFMLDSDMVFPYQTLSRLLAHGKDIVGATYSKRTPPYDTLGVSISGKEEFSSSGLKEVEALPGGCLLIATPVFEKFEDPIFRWGVQGGDEVSEDTMFCRHARKLGYKVWMDVELSKHMIHVGKIYCKIKTLSPDEVTARGAVIDGSTVRAA